MNKMSKFARLAALAAAACLAVFCLAGCNGGGGSDEPGGNSGASDPLASTLGSTSSSCIASYDGTIYYSNFYIGDESDVDISVATKTPFTTLNFLFYGDDAYYVELPVGTSDDPVKLYKSKRDGSDPVVLASDASSWGSFYIVDNKLLYTQLKSDYSGTAVMSIDLASEDAAPTLLQAADGSDIYIQDANSKTVYYTKVNDYKTIYKADANMANEKQVYSGEFTGCSVDGEGDLVIINSLNATINVYPEDGSAPLSYMLSIDLEGAQCKGTNVYAVNENTVYIVDLTTGEVSGTVDLAAGDYNFIRYIDDAYVIYTSYLSDWNGDTSYNTELWVHDIEGDGANKCGEWFSS